MAKGTYVFVIAVVSLLVAGIGYYIYTKTSQPKHVHYHAGFQVYVDDKLQDFSSIKYMTISPCTYPNAMKDHQTATELQNDKGHLHDKVGDVVHVHIAGGTWKDFFNNIHYTFPEGKSIFAFIDGKAVEDILNTPIKPYDSVSIFVGKRDKMQENLKKVVTKKHIKDEEQKSELCAGSN